ncbi:hypothetical protein [Phytohalomonas tamaricis]|uniref:hypothetical protein n=1 Tax=Phytohalomonas tamaricis TaxID=2081032 RepID=UPI000D0ACD36|nr:hypothetical protein [Phytohalomonas tamaricis]
MKVAEIHAGEQRDACVAMLCAAIYGKEAGLKPLIVFTGTLAALFENEAARVLALVDDKGRILSASLLVLDMEGKGLDMRLLATPEQKRGEGYARELVERLTSTTALRVSTRDPRLEGFFKTFGFNKWFYADDGSRIGFNYLSKVTSLGEAPEPVTFSEDAILRTFKRDPEIFNDYKTRFVDSLQAFARYS